MGRALAVFPADAKGLASRDSSGKTLNAIAAHYPWLIGGAADLAPSTKSRLTFEGAGDLEADTPGGRNLHFGFREHAMGAILNGLALRSSRRMAGLEGLVAHGGDPRKVANVASFFVSRIDVEVDGLIEERLRRTTEVDQRAALKALRGKIAIANAKLAYQRYKRLFAGSRWEKLNAKGARVQRLLWASTGTKNPAYSDVLYVEELVGADTVNAMPPATHWTPSAAMGKCGLRWR